jgi:hypothetical protein
VKNAKQKTKGTFFRIHRLTRSVEFQGFNASFEAILGSFEIATDAKLNRIVTSDKNTIQIGRRIEKVELYVDRSLTLESASEKSPQYSFEKFYQIYQKARCFLLSDLPGNGKSIEMKMIAWRLKQAHPSRWVLYLDLKKFTEAFNRMTQFENSFDVGSSLVVTCSSLITLSWKFSWISSRLDV